MTKRCIGIRPLYVAQVAIAVRHHFGLTEAEGTQVADHLAQGKPVKIPGPLDRHQLDAFVDYLDRAGYLWPR